MGHFLKPQKYNGREPKNHANVRLLLSQPNGYNQVPLVRLPTLPVNPTPIRPPNTTYFAGKCLTTDRFPGVTEGFRSATDDHGFLLSSVDFFIRKSCYLYCTRMNPFALRWTFFAPLFAAGVLFSGCQKGEEIQHYTVQLPKPRTTDKTTKLPDGHPPIGDSGKTGDGKDGNGQTVANDAPEKTMLAALIPHSGQAWAFKVTGEPDVMEKFAEPFETFIKGVKFSGENPEWKLPDGWTEGPPRQFGYATLKVADPAVEIAVSSVNQTPNFLADNINRWRGQMSLPPLEGEKLNDSTKKLELSGDLSATVVKLTGKQQAGGMGRPPFAPQGGRNGQ